MLFILPYAATQEPAPRHSDSAGPTGSRALASATAAAPPHLQDEDRGRRTGDRGQKQAFTQQTCKTKNLQMFPVELKGTTCRLACVPKRAAPGRLFTASVNRTTPG